MRGGRIVVAMVLGGVLAGGAAAHERGSWWSRPAPPEAEAEAPWWEREAPRSGSEAFDEVWRGILGVLRRRREARRRERPAPRTPAPAPSPRPGPRPGAGRGGPGIVHNPLPYGTYQVTSHYGWRHGKPHEGIDLGTPRGTRVASATSGRVVHAGWERGYGYSVIVERPNGYRLRYAHLARPPRVRVGQAVRPDTPLGVVGSTGNASGPHLHLEVRAPAGRALDPARFWRF